MKNPLHSYLYKEYVKQITHINKYLSDIRQYKQFLSQKGNNEFANERTHFKLKQTREKLKYHQSIARYLKHEILYYNNHTDPYNYITQTK